MTSVSKMASKDVCGSDHEGIISLLESVLSHFPINIPVESVRRNPIKDVQCAQNKTKQKKCNMLAV
jgi:predicted amino acid-binding ACT domain protein